MRTEVAGPADIPAIVDLFNLVFGQGRDVDDWRRLYSGTPAGPPVSCVIRESGDIVGHLGAIPAWYGRGADRLRGALLVDIMVHPDRTRRGLATRLSLAMHEVLGESFDLSFGFANRQAVPTHLKTGMSNLGRAPVYVRYPRLSARREPRGGGDLRLRPVSLHGPELELRLGEEALPLWHRSRDLATLRWRYSDRPQGRYDFYLYDGAVAGSGYMVLARRKIRGLDAGLIMDIWAGENDWEACRFMLSRAVDLLSGQGVRVIAALDVGNRAVLSALRRLGFLRLPQSVFPSQLNFVFKAYGGAGVDMPLRRKDWYLTWGDTDLV
ncbi:MAG: GNAT family N-acetyltransferase [Actinomycetota bacterium]